MGGRRSGGAGRAARPAGAASRQSQPTRAARSGGSAAGPRRGSGSSGSQGRVDPGVRASRSSGGMRSAAPVRSAARPTANGGRARSSGGRGERRMAQVQAAERLQGLIDERATTGGSVGEEWFTRSGLSGEQRQSAMDYAAEKGYALGNKWADIKNPFFNEAGEQVLRSSKERTPEQIAFRDKLKSMYGSNFTETWVAGLMKPGQKGYDPTTGGGNWVYSQGPTDVESLRAWYRGDPNEGVDTALLGRDRSQFTLEGLFSNSGGQRTPLSTKTQTAGDAQQAAVSRRSAGRRRAQARRGMTRAAQSGDSTRQFDFYDQSADPANYRYEKFAEDYREGYDSPKEVTLESAVRSPFRSYMSY